MDDGSINSFNAIVIRVLIEIDVHLPLKRVLILNGDDELSTFMSYKKLSEACFYYGRMAVEKYGCDMEELEVN